MTLKQKVMARAKELGCEIEEVEWSGHSEILVTAPQGKVFCCLGDVHQLVVTYYPGEKKEAWQHVLGDLTFGNGVEACEVEGCDCQSPVGKSDAG